MDDKPQPATLAAALEQHGVTITADFVPFSQSRNKDEKSTYYKNFPQYSLNWRVTVHHKGRAILTTDYMQGMGNCPSYKANARMTSDYVKAISQECETGRTYHWNGPGKKIEPPPASDVLYSLLLDAEAINAGSFEEWAADYGYDPDSRKAEAIYRQCLEYGLKLRATLGEDVLAQLREAAEGY